MNVRRVVTGHSPEGKAIVASDSEVELGPGGTVVQNGTRHAWRNPFSEPCRMVVVLIGAERVSQTWPQDRP
jgi:hypothetical protein